ncbi:MAG TPA: hypothetical protein VFT39_03490 [Vicinamibacterales bacterium]|nr:hypothetical protein [Vicinamibacterales bacterium]
MVQRLVTTIAACMISSGGVSLAAQAPPQQPPPKNPFVLVPPSERLEIDGSKNPELIPEWYIWETFFRQLHTAGTVPTALSLTANEERFLQMELDQYGKSNQQCQKEIERLRPMIGVAPVKDINEKQRAIQLECRRRSLDIRDRLLAGVRPEASVAIAAWVENLKTTVEISVPKRELAHFRQPR